MGITFIQKVDLNPTLQFKDLCCLIKNSIKEKVCCSTRFSLLNYFGERISYNITFSPFNMNIMLNWVYAGEEIRENISVIGKQSNLLQDYEVYYFVCPMSGVLCRKLIVSSCGYLLNRRAFASRYSSQYRSHYERDFNTRAEPWRAYGKTTYKGRLTPYGRRCLKYEAWDSRRWNAVLPHFAI